MKADDFLYLRKHLAAAVLMVAAGAGGAWFMQTQRDEASAAHVQALAAQQNAQREYARLRDDEAGIREDAVRLQALRQAGVLGEERRVTWLDTLRRLRANPHLMDLRYEFAAPQRLQGQPAGEDQFILIASRLHLDARVLHEGVLLHLLDDLHRVQDALVIARHCRLARPAGGVGGEERSGLQADCELDWITLQAPGADGAGH
ncbi:MAG: hypothetical protein HGA47_01465 [Zoogloea sp.]|nr:hypothetical protein [Zoogloea sp.]